jgi:hypothetical protein
LSARVVPHPWVWAVLYFPLGLAIGFPSVALGYLGSRAGLDVSAVAAIVGMTFLASGWKFLWAPVGDYTLLAQVLVSHRGFARRAGARRDDGRPSPRGRRRSSRR